MDSSELRNRKRSKRNAVAQTLEHQSADQSEKYAESEVDLPTETTATSTSTIADISSNESTIPHAIPDEDSSPEGFSFQVQIDPMCLLLFVLAAITRIYRLAEPNNIVFDELHYGKYVSLYMKRTFFFDQHPPLGKQLIAGIAYLAGYSGNATFSRIGGDYTAEVPTFALRLLPAVCGSLLAPCVYRLLLEVRLTRWMAVVGGVLVIFDNALLTQSRFILMESLLLTFSLLGLLFLLKSHAQPAINAAWLLYSLLSAVCLTGAVSVKFVGIYTAALAALQVLRYFCARLLPDHRLSTWQLVRHLLLRAIIFAAIPAAVYVSLFYVHLSILHRAGPHDSIMTSAFQASLEGGLASITRGQPLNVVHGSQITLRHTHGRTCWLHSHAHVYPVRYADGRGSSHQQQVTCYSFKDVHNWWLVKRPESADLVVGDAPLAIRHGEQVQLVHGITSRALNSHDVAAPVTPQCQEVSCYIDYNVSMSAQILWRVEIVNRGEVGDEWHAIRSQVRLVHVATGLALRFSGRQLPDWGFNQHEIVADRVHEQQDTIWNVEEHRYTKSDDQKERERQLLKAEMIPTAPTVLTFWQKFVELQSKMLWHVEPSQSHMYGSEPLEWPLMSKGIAYWVDKDSNAQIHLIGNIVIWYSATAAVPIYAALFAWYLLRRQRQCYDLAAADWRRFQQSGELFFVGYLLHFVPYLFVERTMFLHNYMPAFVYKLLLLCCVVDHIGRLLVAQHSKGRVWGVIGRHSWHLAIAGWLLTIGWVFVRFSVLSYGTSQLSADDVVSLRWKDTWDFILHKDLPELS